MSLHATTRRALARTREALFFRSARPSASWREDLFGAAFDARAVGRAASSASTGRPTASLGCAQSGLRRRWWE
eukprot:6208240-Pleurochrysis_carterae.AAC.1